MKTTKFNMFTCANGIDLKEIIKEGWEVDKGILDKYGYSFSLFCNLEHEVLYFVDSVTGMILTGKFVEKLTKKDTDEIEKIIKEHLSKKEVKTAIENVRNGFIDQGNILSTSTDKIVRKFQCLANILKPQKENNFSKFIKETELDLYFKTAIYRKSFGNQTLPTNSVLVSCDNITIPYGRKETTVKLDDIISLSDVRHYACINMRPYNIRGKTDKIIKFVLENYIVGVYIEQFNCLIVSDLIYIENYKWCLPIIEFIKKNYLTKHYKKNHDDYVFTVGCDPEFELYNNENKLIVGRDLNSDGRLQRKIGADGAGRQLELRPDASEDPADIIKEITNMFKSLSNLRVNCLGDNEPLGGHIHIGITQHNCPVKILDNRKFANILDTFVGKHLHYLNGKARNSAGYGKIGDIREQPWGFEYRVPASGIFINPKMAYITMKLILNISKAIVKHNIDYCLPLDKEDYKEFLDKEEIEYFFNFKSTYEKLDKENIGKYWYDGKENGLEIVFYDKWDKTVKENFKNILKNTIVDEPTKICLYGVKDTMFSGIYDKIPHPKGIHCDEGIAIGIPRAYRNSGVGIDSVRGICEEIKEKISHINGSNIERTTNSLFPEELIGSNYEEVSNEEE